MYVGARVRTRFAAAPVFYNVHGGFDEAGKDRNAVSCARRVEMSAVFEAFDDFAVA